MELYEKEKSKDIRRVFISKRAMRPSSFDRQKVALALQIFNEKTVAALKADGKLDTAIFVEYITRMWNILNTRSPSAALRLNDADRAPIKSIADPPVVFLLDLATMFEKMESYRGHNRGLTLTRERKRAVVQTLRGLADMTSYLLEKGMKYVLLGHFLSDRLEGHFGILRQLFGGLYLISFEQVLLGEKLQRLKLYDQLNTTPIAPPEEHDSLCCRDDFDDDEWEIIDSARDQVGHYFSDHRIIFGDGALD